MPKVSSAIRQALQTRRILEKLLTRVQVRVASSSYFLPWKYDKLTGLAVAVQMTTDEEVQRNLLRLHGLNLMNNILREYEKDIHVITLVRLFPYRSFEAETEAERPVKLTCSFARNRRISKSSATGNSRRGTRSSRPRLRRTCRSA